MSLGAKLRYGEPVMIPHTPGSAVTAGDAFVLAESVRIAHVDLAANQKGALAAGGGVYEVVKNAGEAWSDGAILYYDAGNTRLTTTASTHKKFGVAAAAALSADTVGFAHHIANH